MPKYLVQDFSWDTVSFKAGKPKRAAADCTFWAQQDEHNHKKSNEFSKVAIAWLRAQGVTGDIREGKFQSNQSNHPPGKEIRWDGKKWTKI